jgi:hypothetical protein
MCPLAILGGIGLIFNPATLFNIHPALLFFMVVFMMYKVCLSAAAFALVIDPTLGYHNALMPATYAGFGVQSVCTIIGLGAGWMWYIFIAIACTDAVLFFVTLGSIYSYINGAGTRTSSFNPTTSNKDSTANYFITPNGQKIDLTTLFQNNGQAIKMIQV